MARKKLLSLSIACIGVASFAFPSFAQYTEDKMGLSEAVRDYTINSHWESLIVDKLMTFNLSPGCWKALTEKDGWGIKTTTNMARAIGEYAKNQGMPDLETTESANNNDRAANVPRVEAIVDDLKGKASFTLDATAIKCDATSWDLLHRYMNTVSECISDKSWKPKGGSSLVTMVMSATAKDITVTVNPDGKHFTIICPSSTEPSEWDTKIVRLMHRGSN